VSLQPGHLNGRSLAGHDEVDYFAREGEFCIVFNDEGLLVSYLCSSTNEPCSRKLYMDNPFFVARARIPPNT
jgi:hypothetical protein